LAVLDEATKDKVLQEMADALRGQRRTVLAANEQDLSDARYNQLGDAMLSIRSILSVSKAWPGD
jgi:glutamate-5-semialdehyde dehydrogenase